MSRAVHLNLGEGEVITRCLKANVGVSAIEQLPDGGVRLVCKSADGAQVIRTKLKSHVIDGNVARGRYRPATPLW